MTKSLSPLCYDIPYYRDLVINRLGIGVIIVIESVYSNEDRDLPKGGALAASFKMPKNIRQIGKGNTLKKIYVEDYVMTFIKQLTGSEYAGCKVAVLVGQCIKLDNCRNIFISGAVEVMDVDTEAGIIFNNDIWTGIYDDIKKYFADVEIVGWCIGGPGYLLEDDDKLLKLHIDNFAGQDKILITYDSIEKEEGFYSYENSRLAKQDGYYIYYEKNEEMQSYMIERRQEHSTEASYDDKVSRDIRTVLQNKRQEAESNRSVSGLMYAAGTLLAVIILVVGAAMLNNYDQMKSMKSTMESLSRNMDEIMGVFNSGGLQTPTVNKNPTADASSELTQDSSADNQQTEESLNVEVLPGNVKPKPTEEPDKSSADAEDKPNKDNSAADGNGGKNTDKADVTEASGADVTEVKEVKYYTVQSGDTLADISYKLYKTYSKVKTIMKLNNIANQDLIYAGQKLIVP